MAPGNVHAAAAVVQHSLTQVCTLLHLFLEQQVAELGETQGLLGTFICFLDWVLVDICKCLLGQAKSPEGFMHCSIEIMSYLSQKMNRNDGGEI